MNSNKETANTETKDTADKVRVWRWWALKYCNGLLAVQLSDCRKGFLNVSLERAFDGSEDWCELEVIGESACSRYSAAQVELPEGLRSLIACMALSSVASDLACRLDEEMIADVPQYGIYLAATRLEAGEIDNGNLQELSTWITSPDAIGCTEESDIENIKRLMEECRKLMPASPGAVLPREEHGCSVN